MSVLLFFIRLLSYKISRRLFFLTRKFSKKKKLMTNSKKFLIITSNEDIIRQFTLHEIKDTCIIDLDNDKQLLPTSNNNNFTVNLSSLSQLTEPVCILLKFQ